MTKQNLVNYIAEEAGLTKADAARALDAFMNGVVKGSALSQNNTKKLDKDVIQELVKLLQFLQETLFQLKLDLN